LGRRLRGREFHLAAALICSKLGIRVAHVEAGLRSRDRTMPEEVNRVITDRLSDLLFTPSADADQNLRGNLMIDTLLHLLPLAENLSMDGLPPRYALVTLHRPSNLDDLPWLSSLLSVLNEISRELPVVFPIHPRTRSRIGELSLPPSGEKFFLTDPKPYLEFLALQRRATVVITDSGGIQEESTFLNVPCLTVRENTERPVTIELGTNQLLGRDLDLLRTVMRTEMLKIAAGQRKVAKPIPLWDGRAAERIADFLGEPV
jgi:UDP-N-acetylglucosamine 2-epimerase (non-hydrolysing)